MSLESIGKILIIGRLDGPIASRLAPTMVRNEHKTPVEASPLAIFLFQAPENRDFQGVIGFLL